MTQTPHTTPYPAYKDSGVEWIGEIPEGWEVKKITWCFGTIGSGTTPKSDDKSFYENGTISWLQTGDLNNGEIFTTSRKITQLALNRLSSLKVFPLDSVVIAMYGATIGKLGILKIEAATNQACCVLSQPNGLYHKFIFYWLMSNQSNIISLGYGGGQPNISQDLIRSLRIPIPPLPEQNAIARYLDEKTAQVDQLIQQSEKIIALLREQRSAVINHAVTKGLTHLPPEQDGTLGVPLYDSGVEWIGEVPEGWAVKKLKYVIKSTLSGGTPSTENDLYWEGDIPWVSAKDMKFDEINSSQDYITELAIKESSTTLVPVNSVLMVVRSGILKHTLPTAINSVEVAINQDLKAFTPIDALTAKYLWYIFKGLSNEILTSCSKLSATVDSIEMGFLENFAVSLPPLSQQIAIARYLDEKTAEIDTLAEREERRIELLREYRSALISEVVTGKVRVAF